MNTSLMALIITVSILLIFTVIRVLVLWYWRVDDIVSLLEEIRDELKNKK